MAMPQASSRLEMLQARFQQKQMQEKEQKLLQLYDQQQQRAYQVVQRGSAGSTGSVTQQHSVTRTSSTTHTTTTTQGGKVRQMFDERRQTTVKGIDRSYPLEPLDNKPKKQITATSNGHPSTKNRPIPTVTRQTVTVKRTGRADMNSNVNGGKPVVSYDEVVTHESYGNDNDFEHENHNRKYYSATDDGQKPNGVHIEEILDEDTIQRNRLMAKIHLMEFDKTLRHRVNNDLNSEEFPEDLMVDVPDKLPKKPVARKLSQAEARLERFKNANAKRNTNAVSSTNTANTIRNGTRSEPRKKSEPMFPATRTTSRHVNIWSKTTESAKSRRSADMPLPPKSAPLPETTESRKDSLKRKDSETVVVKPSSPPREANRTVAPRVAAPVAQSVKSTRRKLSAETVESSTNKGPKHSSRIQKSPSPEPTGRKSSNSSAGAPTRRSMPTSPSKSPDSPMSRRNSGIAKSPDPKPIKSPAGSQESARVNHQISSRPAGDTGDGSASDNRHKIDYSKSSQFSLAASATAQKSSETFVIDLDDDESKENEPATKKPAARNVSNERAPAARTQRQSSPTARQSSPRPPSALSTASSSAGSPRVAPTVAGSQSSRKMATKSKTPGSSGSSHIVRGSPSAKSGMTSSDGLVPCKNCGRRFAQDRVGLHEQICTKTGQKKRKQFDAMSHRVRGTELEAFAKKIGTGKKPAERRVKSQKPETKSNWRRKHEDFINAIRSAKQMQAHLAAGGKLSDLPPPPVSDTSDYTQCPHCGRKFNQGAAERHIPKCATMLHNKPNNRNPPKPKR